MTPRSPLFPPVPEDQAYWHSTAGPLPIVYQVGYRCDAAASLAVRAGLTQWPYTAELRLGTLMKVGIPTHASKAVVRLTEIIPRARR